jgi:activator of HSP90 ATPase
MEFTLKTTIRATCMQIYTTWLNSAGHTEMTGGLAKITDKIGGKFTAWDGYIEGNNIALEPYGRIFQSWRTTEFDESDEDSLVELLLEEVDDQTELTLIHTNLPENGEHYIQGWEDYYFTPMNSYFSSIR